MHGLESLLRPNSVAVIGATEDIRTFAGAPIHNLAGHQFKGAVYPVNPGRQQVQGVPCYPTVLDIPGAVDTAVIAVPSHAVVGVLEQVIKKGAASATIISSGFGEEAAGPEGKARHSQLLELIRSSGIRVLGPNTTGLANLADSYVPRAAHNQLDPDQVKSGGVALITQSGACGNIIFNRAQANGVGIGLSVATGDQIDIDIWELCQHVVDDDRFQVVMVVAETLGDPSRLERVALDAAKKDKIIAVLKLGRSDVGRRAVMTHSGSLAGDASVQSAVMRQLGIVEVDDLDDLWRLAQLVDAWGRPNAQAGRLGVLSLSGGEGALIADRCAEYGLELPECSDEFAAFITSNFAYAMASNPFDPSGEITSRPEKLRLAVRGFLERNTFSEVLFASPVLRTEQAERQYSEIGALLEEPKQNVCASFWSAGELTDTQERILRGTGLPVFAGSGAAIRAIALYHGAGRRRREIRVSTSGSAPAGVLRPDSRYFAVRRELDALGVRFPEARLVGTEKEAVEAARRIGFPVVMKANVVSSVHKFASGLIALDLRSERDVAAAFDRLVKAGKGFGADGVVVEGRAAGNIEVLVGATRDYAFGATLLFGSGGTAVEYFRDSAVAISRYSDLEEDGKLVRSTRIGGFLNHQAPAAVSELANLLAAVGAWFAANPQLTALDLNPIIVDVSTGTLACVDARVA